MTKSASPESYTPKHLAEKILTFKAALEEERKQVTVLFADLKGSLELLADRDPEDVRRLLDPGQRGESFSRPILRQASPARASPAS
jgi:class 3 adenylate cyclase